jgi:hypothetical protein
MIFAGLKNQTILDSQQSQQDLYNFGIQLMPQKNFSRMGHLDKSFLKLNFTVQLLMRMVFAIVVELMEVFIVGIKEVS